uniref:Uncharacterized protein n=1 Tax=Rhizophora mucronata TaxID=61149 RepID=A0A2P2IMB7_RHIMU
MSTSHPQDLLLFL